MTSRRLFVLAICAGSFLLFLVQPMIARMALPRLGGAPAVWNSAMLVYQALLLAGYGYAHWIGRWPPRRQAIIHLLLFASAALTLPIGLLAGDPSVADPALWALWLLGGSIGPLFFVIAAQAPLLQRWFALSGGQDPYPLYAASNLGSFAGLLAYPLLVEPFMPLRAQSLLWSSGYVLLFLIVLACTLRLPRDGPQSAVGEGTPPPTLRVMAKWVVLAAVPSGLMLSTSLHLTTDIVAMPLLWVMPLGLYLLSFSVAFSDRRSLADAIGSVAPLLVLIGASVTFIDATNFPLIVSIATLLVLFVLSVALHGRLHALRPPVEHLTRYYFAMSVGGMLGGVFGALIAPLLFDWTYEHPLLLIATTLLLRGEPLFSWSGWLWETTARRRWTTVGVIVGGLLLSSLGAGMLLPAAARDGAKVICFMAIIAMGVAAIGQRVAFAAAVASLMLCLGGWSKLSLSATPGAMTRSYFGIYMVRDMGPDRRVLVHGTTIHGIQNKQAGHETDPTSYYAPKSGVGLAMEAAPILFGPNARIGVVGLGTGTLACYARPGQLWRFYEIDPAMVAIARDPSAFTFLSRCMPDPDVVVGDARIMLAEGKPRQFDVLAIDAFSSDSIPMHLLTREAIALYGRVLSPRGLLLIHVSNRFLDLEPLLDAAAKTGGWSVRVRHYRPGEQDAGRHYSASNWVAMARDDAQLRRLEKLSADAPWQRPEHDPGLHPWTDDYGSILPLLKIWRNAQP